ncbi:MAG TPA: hypothetical protein VFH38_11585 [Jatrophihabitans sp.]|nr:hypothetical protein [Jatrophihabitans sp.]
MRLRNAADALRRAERELEGRLAPGDRSVPGLLAARVLESDDRYGRASGLVVQGDALEWTGLVALEQLARRGRLAHQREEPHPAGVTPLTCPVCAAVFALGVHLVDGLRNRGAAGQSNTESLPES